MATAGRKIGNSRVLWKDAAADHQVDTQASRRCAVKTPVGIAISVYVLAAIDKNEPKSDMWPTCIVQHLRNRLPPGFVAEPRVHPDDAPRMGASRRNGNGETATAALLKKAQQKPK